MLTHVQRILVRLQSAWRQLQILANNAQELLMDVKPLELNIFWLMKRHLDQVLEIEQTTFSEPWSEEEFFARYRQRNCVAKVAIDVKTDRVVGYVVYELRNLTELVIVNLAVADGYRRMGVGTRLVQSLGSITSKQKRRVLSISIREQNLEAQLFFRKQGFLAIRIDRDGEETSYLFQYRLWADEFRQEHEKVRPRLE